MLAGRLAERLARRPWPCKRWGALGNWVVVAFSTDCKNDNNEKFDNSHIRNDNGAEKNVDCTK